VIKYDEHLGRAILYGLFLLWMLIAERLGARSASETLKKEREYESSN